MPLGSNITPEQILHELKCSKKIHELYSLKDGVSNGWLLLGAGIGVLGTMRALKGRKYSYLAGQCTGILTIFTIPTCWFHVSVFFQIIITKLM